MGWDRTDKVAGAGRSRLGRAIVAGAVVLLGLVLAYALWGREGPRDVGLSDPKPPTPSHAGLLPDAAWTIIQRAVDDCRRHPTAHNYIMLGLMYHGNGLTRLARECYEIAVELGATDARTPYLLGLILLEDGEFLEAAAMFRASIDVRDDYPLAHHHLGRSLLYSGDEFGHDALEAMMRAVEVDPRDPMLYVGLGKVLRVHGRLDEAERSLRHALRLDPDNAAAHQLLGLVLHGRGDAVAATEHLARLRNYNASVYNDPWLGEAYRYTTSVDVRLGWARDLMRFGRLASAVSDLERLAAANPDHPGVFRDLGEALVRSGNDQRALDVFSRAAHLDPGNAGAPSAMAQILLRHGMFDEADKMAAQAIEIDPAALDAIAVRGVVALRQGRAEEAVEKLRSVIERRADHANALLFLGEALIETGEYEAALDALHIAAPLHRSDGAYVNLQIGIAYARQGLLEDADNALRAAAEAAPENETIKAEIAALNRKEREGLPSTGGSE